MLFDAVAHAVALVIEVVGIGIIVVGAVLASVVFVREVRGSFQEAYQDYRSNLGRAILLGLEFLVAGDIVGTVVVDPTFESLGVLGLIVLIRTALSFALGVEIHGHWPWRSTEMALRREAAAGASARSPS